MNERLTQVLDISVTIIIFTIGCIVGKVAMDTYNTWISFNGPAIGILLVGEGLWFVIRRALLRRRTEHEKKRT